MMAITTATVECARPVPERPLDTGGQGAATKFDELVDRASISSKRQGRETRTQHATAKPTTRQATPQGADETAEDAQDVQAADTPPREGEPDQPVDVTRHPLGAGPRRRLHAAVAAKTWRSDVGAEVPAAFSGPVAVRGTVTRTAALPTADSSAPSDESHETPAAPALPPDVPSVMAIGPRREEGGLETPQPLPSSSQADCPAPTAPSLGATSAPEAVKAPLAVAQRAALATGLVPPGSPRANHAGLQLDVPADTDAPSAETPDMQPLETADSAPSEAPPIAHKSARGFVQGVRAFEPQAAARDADLQADPPAANVPAAASTRRAMAEFELQSAPTLRARPGFAAAVAQVVAAVSAPDQFQQSTPLAREIAPGELQASGAPKAPEVLTNQLVRAITLSWRDGIGEAHVRLEPESLGTVTVALKVERGVVTATLVSDVAAVRDSISLHERELRAALATHGLELDRLVVSADADSERRQQDGSAGSSWRRPQRQPQGQRRFELDA